MFVTPANEQERAWVAELAEALCNKRAANRWIWRTWIKATLGNGQRQEVQAHAIISLEVVKHPESKRGFVLLPRRLCRGTRFRVGIAVSAVGKGV